MKIYRINLALTAFKKQCELGKLPELFYNVQTNEIWCSGEPDFSVEKCGPALKSVTGIPFLESWMCNLYMYGMSRRLIEEIVQEIIKDGV